MQLEKSQSTMKKMQLIYPWEDALNEVTLKQLQFWNESLPKLNNPTIFCKNETSRILAGTPTLYYERNIFMSLKKVINIWR